MGLRPKNDAIHRFVLGCQGLMFIGSVIFIFQRRYHKDTQLQNSIDNEREQISILGLLTASMYEKFIKFRDSKIND